MNYPPHIIYRVNLQHISCSVGRTCEKEATTQYVCEATQSSVTHNPFRLLFTLFVYPDGSQHWEQEERSQSEKSSSFLDHAPSAQVEITGYVLLALVCKPNRNQEDLTKASRIVQWIIRQQNPYGGFSSTQVLKLSSAPQPVLAVGTLVQGASGALATESYFSFVSAVSNFSLRDPNTLFFSSSS